MRVSIAFRRLDGSVMGRAVDTVLGVYEKPEDAISKLTERVSNENWISGHVHVYEVGSIRPLETYSFDKTERTLKLDNLPNATKISVYPPA
ncbi:MAG: hypothetical protein QMD97_00710 [Candidatus Aenigmarchaeota archaeon]|nr:hypothetical protein [Candidatus Aenigmarchaeota archaeon]